jgi:Mrp family chromosome partitioning ATPase
LLSLIRRGRVSVLVALVVFLLGLPLVWIKGQSQFTSEAVFQVWPHFQRNLTVEEELRLQSNSQYREFVNHLQQSVLRYDSMERALLQLRRDGLNPCLPPEDARRCIERLQRVIYVRAIPDTYMVKVGMTASQREPIDRIVNAVTDSFLETTRNEQIYGADERLRTLEDNTQVLRGQISDFEHLRAELAGKLGLTTFNDGSSNPYDDILSQARLKLNQASDERSQAQAALQAWRRLREAPASAGRTVQEMQMLDASLNALRTEATRRQEEIGRTLAGLAPGHPAYEPALAEQKELRERLRAREAESDAAARQVIDLRLSATLSQASQAEADARARMQSIESQASEFATHFREAMRLTDEIRIREKEIDQLRGRINFLEGERNALGFVRIVSRALPPGIPMGIGKTRLLLALMAASLAVALGLPMVLDMLDRHVLAVGDAERAMGIAAAGWLVRIEDEGTRRLGRDQLRRLASTLLRNRARGASASFGFAGVKVGSGASTVAIQLAATLHGLGKRVLLVDANTFVGHSPLQASGHGLCDLLAGISSPAHCVQQQEVEGCTLSVVPYAGAAGLEAGHEGEGLQRLDRLQAAIAQWSADYELVLFDLPPLLLSADAELLIDLLGQVFLVVEVGATTRGEVAQARALLHKLDPAAVGLIVNKLPLEVAGESVRQQMVEAITHERLGRFMSMSELRLQYELLRLRLQQWRTGWRWGWRRREK